MNARCIGFVREDCLKVLNKKAETLNALRGQLLVVTGGTGFVGTWLAELITSLNDEYSFNTKVVLVSRSTDHFKAVRPHLSNRRDVELVKSDVRNFVEFPLETGWVIHAAANPDSRFHSSFPVETMTSIANGTEATLKSADRCTQLKMFLNLSSGWVYGSQPSDLEQIPETFSGPASLQSVSNVYSEAKRYSEMLCVSYRSQFQLPVTNVRPFAFIGPYQSLTSPWAMNNFIHNALSGNPIRVLGDGKTVRSYMYPSDMAFWILRILVSAQSGSVYNLGSPYPIEIEKLANLVSQQISTRPEVIFTSNKDSMLPRSVLVPSVRSAMDSFGLEITVQLEEAISRTIQWNRLGQSQ